MLTKIMNLRRDAEFSELQCELTHDQEALYDAAVQLWQVRCVRTHACMLQRPLDIHSSGPGTDGAQAPGCMHACMLAFHRG